LGIEPPQGAIRLIVLLASQVNHRFPSGPATIPFGALSVLGGIVGGPGFASDENSVTTPAGVTRPMRSGMLLVNQRLPSGPGVMSSRGWVAIETEKVEI
jgi:hypothetical protein